MSDPELDRAYDAAATVPSLVPYIERWTAESVRARATYGAQTDLAYGPRERERLDYFEVPDATTLLVFFHGGYWRRLSKNELSFVAIPFVTRGVAVALPSYELAPNVRLDEIVREARAAVAWIAKHTAARDGTPKRIFVAGHSAGGQLAGMVAATDWSAHDLPQDLIAGVGTISGLFDLEPVSRSNVNDWMHLDAAEAYRNSPIHHLPNYAIPLIAAVGEIEASGFHLQTAMYADAWAASVGPARRLDVHGRNHYDIVLDLLDPQAELTRSFIETFGI